MPRILLTCDAKADLAEIWRYVEAEAPAVEPAEYPPVADRLLERIYNVFETLAIQPHMGRISSVAEDLRVFTSKPYLIFYRPGHSVIEVARVLHTARDIQPDYF